LQKYLVDKRLMQDNAIKKIGIVIYLILLHSLLNEGCKKLPSIFLNE